MLRRNQPNQSHLAENEHRLLMPLVQCMRVWLKPCSPTLHWTTVLALCVAAGCSLADLDHLGPRRSSGKAGTSGRAGSAGANCTTAGRPGANCGGNSGGGGLGAATAGDTNVPPVGVGGATTTTLNAGAGTAGATGAAVEQGGMAGSESLAAGSGSLLAGASGAAGVVAGVIAGTGNVGAAGAAFTPCTGDPKLVGPATRPQLTAAAAEEFTLNKYLAQAGTLGALTVDNWDPTAGLGFASKFVPTYTVAADGSGTHTSLQAAITTAAASAELSRAFILVKPGIYREVVCVNAARPITIYGADADASLVRIVFGNNSGKSVDTGVNPCAPPASSATTYGNPASATVAIKSNEAQLKNITVANDFVEGSDVWAGGQQAVALLTLGDRITIENVRVVGNHFTTLFNSPDPSIVSRVYVKDSYIAGDMQFIVGRATLVMDSSEIRSLTSRISRPLGSIIAATTAAQNPYGYLFWHSYFTVDASADSDWVLMGRSWDEGATTYVEGTSPNGQVVIRESILESHIKKSSPWGNALDSGRIYDCLGNRLYEYANTGPGAWP